MVEITKNGNVSVILFTDSDYYLFNSGQILAPLGSLTMVLDKSDMVTFRKAANNDLLFSAKIGKVKINGTQLTRENAQSLFDSAMGGGSGSGLRFEEVDELPETGENGVIYLVPNGDDTFTEWVWIENEQTFEKLGYDVDLSDYYTKEEIDDAHLTISAALNELHDDNQDLYNYLLNNYYNDQWVDMHLLELQYALEAAIAGLSDVYQPLLTFDTAPTQNSTNPVTSGGVYTALGNKQDSLVYDNIPTVNSTNSVTSGGIFNWVTSNYYNDQWVDMHLQELEENVNEVNRVVSTALNRLNSGKADVSSVYTKSEVDTALGNKQNTLTFDTAPTNASTNPVTSGGVYTALGNKQDTLTFDNAPTNDSTNPVTSGGVYTALSGKQDTLTFDTAPVQNSTNPVTSGGLYTVLGDISTALSTIIGNNS